MICIRQSGNDRAKQDMERQRYNNYNKMKNSKCIRFPSSACCMVVNPGR